jgi:hypothetical protein
MDKKEMQKRLKELYKIKSDSIAERIKINKEIIYLEMQLERIINNNQ